MEKLKFKDLSHWWTESQEERENFKEKISQSDQEGSGQMWYIHTMKQYTEMAKQISATYA